MSALRLDELNVDAQKRALLMARTETGWKIHAVPAENRKRTLCGAPAFTLSAVVFEWYNQRVCGDLGGEACGTCVRLARLHDGQVAS